MAVTLLAMRCRGTIRSPARYLYSEDSTLTGAVGAARELAVIARIGACAYWFSNCDTPHIHCSRENEARITFYSFTCR